MDSHTRKIYCRLIFIGLVLVTLAIFSVFSIYWGAQWRIPAHSLTGLVVDFDNGQIGNTITPQLANLSSRSIKWSVAEADDFPGGIEEAAEFLLDDKAWVVVAINQNASQTLAAALTTPNPSYNGSQAITALAVEARNENAFRAITRPTVQTQLDALVSQFAVSLVQTLPALAPAGVNLTDLVVVSPQTVVTPVGYTMVNIRPFDVPVATAPMFVGLIYLSILSFFFLNIALAARTASGLEFTLSTRNLVLLRLGTAITGYFFISLFYSLLSVAFQLPVRRRFGDAGFVIFWMLNWAAMGSLGLALESMVTLLTPRFVPLFMILWMITNASVTFQPIEILPSIYRYGRAAPFYLVSRGIRTIVFSTKNTLDEDFGILVVWIAISFITLPIFQVIARRRDAAPSAKSQRRGGGAGASPRATGEELAAGLERNASRAQSRSVDEKQPSSIGVDRDGPVRDADENGDPERDSVTG